MPLRQVKSLGVEVQAHGRLSTALMAATDVATDSCSHTRMTVHPASRNLESVSASRSIFLSSFFRHQSAFDDGQWREGDRRARSIHSRTRPPCVWGTLYPLSAWTSQEPGNSLESGIRVDGVRAGYPFQAQCHAGVDDSSDCLPSLTKAPAVWTDSLHKTRSSGPLRRHQAPEDHTSGYLADSGDIYPWAAQRMWV